eukprot:1658119-Amphidinium_carterae.1
MMPPTLFPRRMKAHRMYAQIREEAWLQTISDQATSYRKPLLNPCCELVVGALCTTAISGQRVEGGLVPRKNSVISVLIVCLAVSALAFGSPSSALRAALPLKTQHFEGTKWHHVDGDRTAACRQW